MWVAYNEGIMSAAHEYAELARPVDSKPRTGAPIDALPALVFQSAAELRLHTPHRVEERSVS